MDHDEAVRQNATERYLLDELDPELRDQFEEHLFDCQDCALDLRAGAMFVEQTKVILAEPPAVSVARVPVTEAAKPGWLAWLRPAFRTCLRLAVGCDRVPELGYVSELGRNLESASGRPLGFHQRQHSRHNADFHECAQGRRLWNPCQSSSGRWIRFLHLRPV